MTSVACTMEPRKIRKLKVLTGFRPVSDPLPRCFRTLFFFILLAFSFLSSFLFLIYFGFLFWSFLFFSFLFFSFLFVSSCFFSFSLFVFFPVVFSFLLEPYGLIHDTSNIDLSKNLSRASDVQVSRKAGPRRVYK